MQRGEIRHPTIALDNALQFCDYAINLLEVYLEMRELCIIQVLSRGGGGVIKKCNSHSFSDLDIHVTDKLFC